MSFFSYFRLRAAQQVLTPPPGVVVQPRPAGENEFLPLPAF